MAIADFVRNSGLAVRSKNLSKQEKESAEKYKSVVTDLLKFKTRLGVGETGSPRNTGLAKFEDTDKLAKELEDLAKVLKSTATTLKNLRQKEVEKSYF